MSRSVFGAVTVGRVDSRGIFTRDRILDKMVAVRNSDLDRYRCRGGCATCHYQKTSGANKTHICPQAYGRINRRQREYWTDHIQRGIQSGHLYSEGGRYYSKGLVSEGGQTYRAGDYYAVPTADRRLEAVNAPSGSQRRVVHRAPVVVSAGTGYVVGVTPVVRVVRVAHPW
mgnify:CR=1 FL=1